ncbi:MAG: RNA-directed DNA polymerase [Thiobacillus sp.]|nr:RNA-directed DNA polymerase [Thiobacillus sp.]
MGWTNASFISLADLYVAYRKAKVDMYYERDHVTALAFCDYEERLDANLESLFETLNSPDPTWMRDLGFVGSFSYIPKALAPCPEHQPKQATFIHSTPDESWAALSRQCTHEAKFRLIGRHPIHFHVVSALWIQTVGHLYDGILGECAYGSRLRRGSSKDGKLSVPTASSMGNFRPYSFGFRAWRENGLEAIHKALDEDKSVIAVTADLRSFYHEASPEYLLNPKFLDEFGIKFANDDQRVFTEQMIEAIRTWAQNTPEHREVPTRGIPVGLSAPRVIANTLLAGFDKMIRRELAPLYYGRYVDDVLLVLDNQRGMASDEEVWRHISERSKDMIKVSVEEGEPAYRLNLPYSPSSNLRFAGSKQKVFSLKGSSGKSLLNSISRTIAQRSSEWRLLPDLPSDSEELTNDFVTAGQDATEEVDNLRKSDGLSVRRLAFALRLRNFEAVQRDLKPEEWRSHRDKFFNLAIDHMITVPGLFAYGPYLARLVGLAVACRDWSHAAALIRRLLSVFQTLAETTRHDGDQIRKCKLLMLEACLEAALKAIGNGNYQATDLQGFLNSFEGEEYFYIFEMPGTEGCLAQGKRLYAADLARESFREIWLDDEDSDVKTEWQDEWNIRLPEEIVTTFRLEDAEEFLESTRLAWHGVPRAIAFPTRPFTPSEIVLLDQACLTNTQRFNRYVRALRGSELFLEELVKNGHPPEGSDNAVIDVPNRSMPSTPMVAVPCFETKDVSWVASVAQTPDPDPGRYFRLNNLVNEVLKTRKVQYLILPELALPRRWFNRLAHKLSQSGVSLIAGLEYLHYKSPCGAPALPLGSATGFVSNQVRASLVTDLLGYPTHMIYVQEKERPAPGEEKLLHTIAGKLLRPKEVPQKPIIRHGSLHFGILICSELTNLDFRAKLRGKVDALFVPEWNRDTNSFASLVEATALDMHCFVVQANNRTYGDCRIRAPYSEPFERDVVRVKGGETDYFVIGKIDVPGLRAFQSNYRSPEAGAFKPVPDGYEPSPDRKVRPFYKNRSGND